MVDQTVSTLNNSVGPLIFGLAFALIGYMTGVSKTYWFWKLRYQNCKKRLYKKVCYSCKERIKYDKR